MIVVVVVQTPSHVVWFLFTRQRAAAWPGFVKRYWGGIFTARSLDDDRGGEGRGEQRRFVDFTRVLSGNRRVHRARVSARGTFKGMKSLNSCETFTEANGEQKMGG